MRSIAVQASFRPVFAGDVTNSLRVVADDLIGTGGTLVRAAKAARAHGATKVIACVAHGLFMPGAETALADLANDRIIATDGAPPFRLPPGPVLAKLEIVSAAPLLQATGRAVRRFWKRRTGPRLMRPFLEGNGLFARAIADYDVILKADPTNGALLHARGTVRAKLGDHVGANADFGRTESVNSGRSTRAK